jgi:hypothetical protein
MKLAQTRSVNIVQNEEPVLLATAHSTGRLCEAKHMSDIIVACFMVNSIVAINAMGAYIGRKQLVKNTIDASEGSPKRGKTALVSIPTYSIIPTC